MEPRKRCMEEAINLIEQGEVQSVKEMAEKLDVNPMFLSGCLHALHELDVVEKNDVGGTHIYTIKDKEKLEKLREGYESDVF